MRLQTIKYLLVPALLMLPSFILVAQPGGGGSPGNNGVPLTGIEYLVGGGALMGLRYFRNRMKMKHK
jgi:hypothetical protein